jgi:hypothetical protein
MEVLTTTKPNTRPTKGKKGINTGNTIRNFKFPEVQLAHHKFKVQRVDEYVPFSNFEIQSTYFKYNSNQKLTINKDKRWEHLEELMIDPNYVVIENCIGKYTKKKKFKEMYTTTPKEAEEVEENSKLIQGRKGKTIKQKREPGKKGILKKEEEGKIYTEAEFVVEVVKPLTLKSKAYKTDESRPGDDEWRLGIEKNHHKKKRNHIQRQCNL